MKGVQGREEVRGPRGACERLSGLFGSIGLFAVAVLASAGCGSDEPALTLELVNVPAAAAEIEVRLRAGDTSRFSGAMSSRGGVSVVYASDGSLVLTIGRAYAAEHKDRLRLPLRAPRALTLKATAHATSGDATLRAEAETAVKPNASATLRLVFALSTASTDAGGGSGRPDGAVPPGLDSGSAAGDGGDGASSPSDAGRPADDAPRADGALDASSTPAPDARGDASSPSGLDAAVDLAALPGDATAVTPDAAPLPPPDAPETFDAPEIDAMAAPPDLPPPAWDLPPPSPDEAPWDAEIDQAAAQPDLAVDLPPDSAPDLAPDRPPATCTVSAVRPASVASASGAPTLAHQGGLFGLAWTSGANDTILYNSITASGTIQNASADTVAIAAASGATYASPRLQRAGDSLVLAYGRRSSNGQSFASVARLATADGALLAGPTPGASATDSAPPEVGDVAVSADGTHIATVSRSAADMQTAATVSLFTDALVFSMSQSPPSLSLSRKVGIGWALPAAGGRFGVTALVDSSSSGGTLSAFSDGNLAPGASVPFTAGSDAPLVGFAGSRVSVVGVGSELAVAWTDAQSCTGCSGSEVFVTIVDLAGNRPFGEVQASEPSAVSKRYPHIVFDGQALAVAWLEYTSSTSSSIKLRRFDRDLTPLGAARDVGPATTPKPVLADFGLAAGAPGEYGVAMWLFINKQHFTHITCTGQ